MSGASQYLDGLQFVGKLVGRSHVMYLPGRYLLPTRTVLAVCH